MKICRRVPAKFHRERKYGQDLIEFHEKAKSYDWKFTVGDQRPKYKSKYIIPEKGRDPFRMLVRDYMKMESEKDNGTYGMLDGALRMGMADRIQPRFVECLKLTLPDLTNAEFQAVAACGGIISSVQNQELRQGYQAQMLDEIRHTQLEMSLRNYYVKHWQDPAGWDIAQKALYQHPGGIVSLGEFYHFNTGDPIDCIVALNIVIETAFTNILLVAVPQIGVANGDHALATTFLTHPVGRVATHGERLWLAARRLPRPEQRKTTQQVAGTPLLALPQVAGCPGRLAVRIRRYGAPLGL